MQIAFDYQIFCLQAYGGISRYFTRLAQELHCLRQEVRIFAPLHQNSYLLSIEENMVDGRYIYRYPPKTTRFYLAYNFSISNYKINRWAPDVLHQTYYSRLFSGPKKVKSVITVYDMIHELYPDQFPIWDNTINIKKKAIQRADQIICISENTKNDLMHFYRIPEKKVSVVHLGFDEIYPASIAKVFSTNNERPYLLYVGNRAGYKNFSGFLRAVALSKRLIKDFDVFAFGGGKFTNDEKTLISELGFRSQQVTQYSGDDLNLQYCYQTARAFVYPSLYEGFGMPPLEAMARGCPVISSNTSSMPEVIGFAAEFFNPNSIEEMGYAIEKVVYSDEAIDSLKIAGKNRLKHFSWEKCAKDTLKIYQG
jgi:glycosyltransferase involved in cell wall biosynthesis